jgi:hypothetical protein
MTIKYSSAEKPSNLSGHLLVTAQFWLRQDYGTLRNQKTVKLVNLINHPGRKQYFQYFDFNCTAATPPSKGGEICVTNIFTMIHLV